MQISKSQKEILMQLKSTNTLDYSADDVSMKISDLVQPEPVVPKVSLKHPFLKKKSKLQDNSDLVSILTN
jgi:hypothetical protein